MSLPVCLCVCVVERQRICVLLTERADEVCSAANTVGPVTASNLAREH